MQIFKKITPFIGILMIIGFSACQSSSSQKDYTYIEEGLDTVIKQKSSDQNFTIILKDMDYKEADKKFLHQYQIVTLKQDSVAEENTTDWMQVSPAFFELHQNDLGMELAAKTDGVLKKETAPPGYSQYVGNDKYGEWKDDGNGNSFWAFYGRYAMMSMMFNSVFTPRRSSWGNYNKSYRGTGKPYYGSGGSTYGTKGAVASGKSTSSWSKKPSTFRDKVRTQVKQSASTQRIAATKAKNSAKSKAKSGSSTKKTTRTGSSTRSRGGGFGK